MALAQIDYAQNALTALSRRMSIKTEKVTVSDTDAFPGAIKVARSEPPPALGGF